MRPSPLQAVSQVMLRNYRMNELNRNIHSDHYWMDYSLVYYLFCPFPPSSKVRR